MCSQTDRGRARCRPRRGTNIHTSALALATASVLLARHAARPFAFALARYSPAAIHLVVALSFAHAFACGPFARRCCWPRAVDHFHHSTWAVALPFALACRPSSALELVVSQPNALAGRLIPEATGQQHAPSSAPTPGLGHASSALRGGLVPAKAIYSVTCVLLPALFHLEAPFSRSTSYATATQQLMIPFNTERHTVFVVLCQNRLLQATSLV